MRTMAGYWDPEERASAETSLCLARARSEAPFSQPGLQRNRGYPARQHLALLLRQRRERPLRRGGDDQRYRFD